MNRDRYDDRYKTQLPAEIVKYKRGERAKVRHNRRHKTNCEHMDRLRNWCNSNGFVFSVANENMHWQVKRGDFFLDWWPVTAKMVICQQFDKGIHVHDVGQVISYLQFVKLVLVGMEIRKQKRGENHENTYLGLGAKQMGGCGDGGQPGRDTGCCGGGSETEAVE